MGLAFPHQLAVKKMSHKTWLKASHIEVQSQPRFPPPRCVKLTNDGSQHRTQRNFLDIFFTYITELLYSLSQTSSSELMKFKSMYILVNSLFLQSKTKQKVGWGIVQLEGAYRQPSELSPAPHELRMAVHTVISAHGKWTQEDQKFKFILSYKVSSRPAWST